MPPPQAATFLGPSSSLERGPLLLGCRCPPPPPAARQRLGSSLHRWWWWWWRSLALANLAASSRTGVLGVADAAPSGGGPWPQCPFPSPVDKIATCLSDAPPAVAMAAGPLPCIQQHHGQVLPRDDARVPAHVGRAPAVACSSPRRRRRRACMVASASDRFG
jgi:hypothetical protein